ncbi:MAG: hypothetical protein LBH46_01345 [Rickettsiales bacterium]|jgi:DNA-binding protein YbaB|nr:hypothetical protein [Rickettsiales bacterium]
MVVVPKSDPYIKQAEQIAPVVPSSTMIAANAIGNAAGKIGDIMLATNEKIAQFELENNRNDYIAEYDLMTKQYQQEYQRQPDEKLTKQYYSDVKKLNEKYTKQAPDMYKGLFVNQINDINYKNGGAVELWKNQVDLNYQTEKFNAGVNQVIGSMGEAGARGEDINPYMMALKGREQQAIALMGDVAGKEYTQKASEKAVNSYFSNLVLSNPVRAMDILKEDTLEPTRRKALINVMGTSKVNHYLKEAKKEAIEQQNWQEHVTDKVIHAEKVNFYKKSLQERSMNADDIDTLFSEKEITAAEAYNLYKIGGYNYGERYGQLQAIQEENKKKKEKISNAEKEVRSTELLMKVNILGNNEEDIEDTIKKSEEIHRDLLEARANNLITDSEYEDYNSLVQQKTNKVLVAKSKKEYDGKGFFDYRLIDNDLEKYIKNLNESNNFTIDGDTLKNTLTDKPLNKLEQKQYYLYNNTLRKIAFNKINQNTKRHAEITNSPFENSIDYLNTLEVKDRDKLLKQASKDALTEFASTYKNIDRLQLENKSILQINNMIMSQDTKERQTFIINSINTKKPFKLRIKK